ncbi:MAG TPA: hypothetical protein VFS00_26370 [Polyangiaceae bacterium]|nr:hypothetical protein [Polyangiaceae bacterium]
MRAQAEALLRFAAAATLCATAAACSPQRLVALMPGVINDPRNRTLRRELMSFASGEFCKEVTQRGAPLRMSPEEPVVGRFFARECTYRELDNGDAFVQVRGEGYGWAQPSGRVGFKAGAAIQYNQDFLLDGSTMYVYFRPRAVQASEFESLMVERVQQSPLGGLLGGTAQDIANRVGQQLVSRELARGFTVIRDDNGQTDFGLGVIEKGRHPPRPFHVEGGERLTLANERAEVQAEQVDFLGPFNVVDDGRALFLTLSVEGTEAVDVAVWRREAADPWLESYVRRAGVAQPAGAPVVADVVRARARWERAVPLPKGSYYLVVDHSSTLGAVSPPAPRPGVLGPAGVAATINYAVQVGEAP